MTDEKPELMTREEAEQLLLADRSRQLSARSTKPPVALLPNTMFPFWVFFTDPTIEAAAVVAWHPNGQPMVVDTERGLLVQALAIGDVARIQMLPHMLEE